MCTPTRSTVITFGWAFCNVCRRAFPNITYKTARRASGPFQLCRVYRKLLRYRRSFSPFDQPLNVSSSHEHELNFPRDESHSRVHSGRRGGRGSTSFSDRFGESSPTRNLRISNWRLPATGSSGGSEHRILLEASSVVRWLVVDPSALLKSLGNDSDPAFHLRTSRAEGLCDKTPSSPA